MTERDEWEALATADSLHLLPTDALIASIKHLAGRLLALDTLTFAEVTEANVTRARRWHPGFPRDEDWSLADWSNAMCGEAGEAANVVKKIRRNQCGLRGLLDGPEDELRRQLGEELADVFLYLNLLAAKADIDLADAIVAKFNVVSERQGFPDRLPTNGALRA